MLICYHMLFCYHMFSEVKLYIERGTGILVNIGTGVSVRLGLGLGSVPC